MQWNAEFIYPIPYDLLHNILLPYQNYCYCFSVILYTQSTLARTAVQDSIETLSAFRRKKQSTTEKWGDLRGVRDKNQTDVILLGWTQKQKKIEKIRKCSKINQLKILCCSIASFILKIRHCCLELCDLSKRWIYTQLTDLSRLNW